MTLIIILALAFLLLAALCRVGSDAEKYEQLLLDCEDEKY